MKTEKHELQYFSSRSFLLFYAAVIAISVVLKFAGHYPRFSWVQVVGFPSIFAAIFLAPFAPATLRAVSWIVGGIALVTIIVG